MRFVSLAYLWALGDEQVAHPPSQHTIVTDFVYPVFQIAGGR
jgi:hypothetical protein